MKHRPILPGNAHLWVPRNDHGTRLDNWPRCKECHYAPVEAYGIYDRSDRAIEIWARCHGKHEVLRITWERWGGKDPGWSVLGPHVASLLFFDEEPSR